MRREGSWWGGGIRWDGGRWQVIARGMNEGGQGAGVEQVDWSGGAAGGPFQLMDGVLAGWESVKAQERTRGAGSGPAAPTLWVPINIILETFRTKLVPYKNAQTRPGERTVRDNVIVMSASSGVFCGRVFSVEI